MPRLDLIGNTFGRLRVVALCAERRYGYLTWLCICECGNELSATTSALRSGNTRSCGCMRADSLRPHLAKLHAKKRGTRTVERSPEERAIATIWYGMRARCYDTKNRWYSSYGGRGITMCDDWRAGWEAILRDMGPKPSQKHSLDRIDNDKGYSPANCRWATDHEQNSNRRNTYRVVVDGEVVPLAIVARREGITTSRARYLLKTGRYYPEADPTQ